MEKKIYGVVEHNKNVFFALDGFQCTFINNIEAGSKSETLLKQKHGFILGRAIGETIPDQYVYIFTNKDIEVLNKRVLNIWLYLISSRPSLDSYLGIRFKGGILKKLFSPSQWDMKYNEDETMSVKFTDNRISYMLNDEKVKGFISVGTGVRRSISREDGSSVSTTATELELAFENEKGLDSVSDILTYIMNLCRFMAFRKNICFDEINLANPNPNLPKSFDKVASCHFRFDEPSDISKLNSQCITFNVLGECVDNLLKCIIEGSKSDELNFNINYIPEADKDVYLISSMRIREIFSALETELEANEIKTQAGVEFDELINKIKQVVKEHQTGKTPLNDKKDYDYIYGTLGHMAGSLANRTYIFMQENKSLIRDDLDKEQITTLVNYRNTITHGRFFILDQEQGKTAFVLMRLIYCSILKRIGLEEEKIEKLFERNILS